MIQGATRKATVSVKMSSSTRVCGEGDEDSVGPAGSPLRPQDPPAPCRPGPGASQLAPQAPKPLPSPQRCTYRLIHQADAERDQPREISIGEGEPLHVEADLPLPGMPLNFVGLVLGAQHLLVV